MSTRCQIMIVDEYGGELLFYRHSDGYPDSVVPSLERFLDLVRQRKIRDNVEQAAGWLILIGADEYKSYGKSLGELESAPPSSMGWKVGAYEPAAGIHGDIEYFYVVDLTSKTITIRKTPFSHADRTIRDILLLPVM